MTSIPHDLRERRALDAIARREWAREVEAHRAEEDEHERILDERLANPLRPTQHATVAGDEQTVIEAEAWSLVRERGAERLRECGE